MAVAKKNPVEEEIDPEHPQYQHGMEAGLNAVSTLASLPRVPGANTADPTSPAPTAAGATEAGAVMNRRTTFDPQTAGGAMANLPRTRVAGPTPPVGGTQAVLPPKINPLKTLPRNRNQSAIEQPDPADFFRRK